MLQTWRSLHIIYSRPIEGVNSNLRSPMLNSLREWGERRSTRVFALKIAQKRLEFEGVCTVTCNHQGRMELQACAACEKIYSGNRFRGSGCVRLVSGNRNASGVTVQTLLKTMRLLYIAVSSGRSRSVKNAADTKLFAAPWLAKSKYRRFSRPSFTAMYIRRPQNQAGLYCNLPRILS